MGYDKTIIINLFCVNQHIIRSYVLIYVLNLRKGHVFPIPVILNLVSPLLTPPNLP